MKRPVFPLGNIRDPKRQDKKAKYRAEASNLTDDDGAQITEDWTSSGHGVLFLLEQ